MSAGALAKGLARLSERERLLIGLLTLVAVPLAIVFLVVLPLIGARQEAAADLRDAEEMRNWVSEQVREFPANAGELGSEAAGIAAAFSLSEVEESLVGAGVREAVSQLSDREGGGMDLSFDAVAFAPLGAWLDDISPIWGLDITAFRIEAVSPGLVSARFTLEPAQ